MTLFAFEAWVLLAFVSAAVGIAVGLWLRPSPPQPNGVSLDLVDRWRNITSGLRELTNENIVGLHKLQQQLRKLPSGVAREYLGRIVGDMERLVDNNRHFERVLRTVQSTLRKIAEDSKSTPVLVRDLMSHPVQTIAPTLPAAVAAKRLVDYRIRHLLVVDQGGCLIGVLSDRDVLKHLSPWLSKVKPAPAITPPPNIPAVKDLMSCATITVRAETSLAKAAALMASKRINCLPVVGKYQQPQGVLTTMDLLVHVAASRQPT